MPASAPRRPLAASGWLLLVLLAVFAFGLIASRPASPPDQGPPTGDVLAAQNAVTALTHPGPEPAALALLPRDFTQRMGGHPTSQPARDGTVRAVHPDGGCSAPWGDDDTKWDFSVPCRTHDLGYDLLRYANAKGHPLDQQARTDLDDRLIQDMHHTCDLNPMGSPRTCHAVASLYAAGLVLNSWHQRWGPPVGDPLGPMITGVLVIGCLLVMRLRGWHRARRTVARRPIGVPRPWAVLGVASAVLLIVGESATALADWADAPESAWWPLTWLAQLTPLLFFAGGLANAASWKSDPSYRHYLAERSSPLLRPALIFAVVALIVPLALEVLGIPAGTNATVMRIALHPLWLLGVYLLTVVCAPLLLSLYRRTHLWSIAALTVVVVAGELTASWAHTPWPRYVATLALALLAQQAAFAYANGVRLPRAVLVTAAVAGAGALAVSVLAFNASPVLLGNPGAPAALSARPWSVLLLGVSQLGVVGLLAKPLRRWASTARIVRATAVALRAPMSLYLAFLATMLLLVAVVYLPGPFAIGLSWLLRPRMLVAVALLLVPAAFVFWWFERHPRKPGAAAPLPPRPRLPASGRHVLLSRAAAILGIGYATLGVFGLALARFGAVSADADLLGLRLDPVQSLVHLLLGVLLLHAVRTGAAAFAGTWFVAALTCVPSVVAAANDDAHSTVLLVLHTVTAVFALVAAGACLVPARTAASPAG